MQLCGKGSEQLSDGNSVYLPTIIFSSKNIGHINFFYVNHPELLNNTSINIISL